VKHQRTEIKNMTSCDGFFSVKNPQSRSRVRSESSLGVRKQSENCAALYDFWSTLGNNEGGHGHSAKNSQSETLLNIHKGFESRTHTVQSNNPLKSNTHALELINILAHDTKRASRHKH